MDSTNEADDDERSESDPWLDGWLARSRVPPSCLGLALALGLLVLFGSISWFAGSATRVLASDASLWDYREFRLAVLVASLAGYLPIARFNLTRSAQRNRGELAVGLEADQRDALEPPRPDPHGSLRAGVFGLLIVPITALIVDREPGLYFKTGYWEVEQAFAWVVGGWVAFWVGSLAYATIAWSRHFSRLAGSLRAIDLLDLRPVAPFAHQGLSSSLTWLVLLALITMNLTDLAWFVVLGVFAFLVGVSALIVPVQGVRTRIRAAKQLELLRISGALRGDSSALDESPLHARASGLSIADLLAYRSFVDSIREWPFDTVTIVRFGLYLAIPLGSWLGGALVERLLGAALD